MFYVSNISGQQVPFDPRVTPISNRVALVTESQAIASVGQQTYAKVSEAAEAGAGVFVPLTAPGVAESIVSESEQAATYEGSVLAASHALAGTENAVNIARAGAAMAYRSHEGTGVGDEQPTAADRRVFAVGVPKKVDDDSGLSHDRVNPVRKPSYRAAGAQQERKRAINASDIMTAPVFSLREDQTIADARDIFRAHQFRHVPILARSGKLIGILSDRDFIDRRLPDEEKTIGVRERMVTDILTARPQTEIPAIAELMIGHRIGCLPIVDEAQALVGIITRSDILRAIVRHGPFELWT